MIELTKLSTKFVATALLVGLPMLASIAASEEAPDGQEPPPTSPETASAAAPTVHLGWTTWHAEPSGTVWAKGAWRIRADRATIAPVEISLQGAVRVTGPGVYLRTDEAVVTTDSLRAGNSAVFTKDVRMEAKAAHVAIPSGTLRLVGVRAP